MQVHGWVGDHRTVKRIGPVHRFQLHQGPVPRAGGSRGPIHGPRHGPHPGHRRHPPPGLEPGDLFRAGAAVGKANVEIAAQKRLGIAREAFLNGGGERTDPGDGGDAQGEAGDHHPKTLDAAAQVT